MTRCKKNKKKEEPIILLPKHQDEEEQRDLSWMIQDNDQPELKLNNNKKSKRKK